MKNYGHTLGTKKLCLNKMNRYLLKLTTSMEGYLFNVLPEKVALVFDGQKNPESSQCSSACNKFCRKCSGMQIGVSSFLTAEG